MKTQHYLGKRYIVMGLFVLFSLALSAEFVSPQKAVQVAGNWMAYWQQDRAFELAELLAYRDEELIPLQGQGEISQQELPELYLLYFEAGGFAIVPADDNLRPVLAYSTDPLENRADMPPAFKYWLGNYASDVRYVREQSADLPGNRALWPEVLSSSFGFIDRDGGVSPLLSTVWNQDWPYNELCPLDPDGPGGRVYVGCVAVAMAQVMKYWGSPITGVGTQTYYAQGYGYQTANFGDATYLWDEMPNSVSSSNIPVATILYHAAVGAKMGFSPYGSGAQGTDATDALNDHFRYQAASYAQRYYHGSSSWENLMKEQLDNGVPMYYSGSNTESGHAFNLDGYQGTNHFHFNFGWGGAYDGYYYLTSINPGSTSFNLYQAAIINTIPDGYSIDQTRIRLAAPGVTAGDPFDLTMSTNPVLGSWDVTNYSFRLFYEHDRMEYLGAEISGTISEDGLLVANSTDPGYVDVIWMSSEPLMGAGDLVKFRFRAIEPGTSLFSTVDMTYNTHTLQNVEPLLLEVESAVASLEESSISLSNAMHVAHNELGTMQMSSSYLPPSWNVTHYDFELAFDPQLVAFEDIMTENTMSEGLEDMQITELEPGRVKVSCDFDGALSGGHLPLAFVRFLAIGNASTIQVATVDIEDFYFNQTPIANLSGGMILLSPTTSIEEEFPPVQVRLTSYPNPFNPSTNIRLYLPEAGRVTAGIYNMRGQRVCSLMQGLLPAGEHSFVWNGVDDSGQELGSGIYLLKVHDGSRQMSRKLSLIK